MSAADHVLDGMGEGLAIQAGPAHRPFVEALCAPLEASEELVGGEEGWSLAFDLGATPWPAWLGQLAGVAPIAGTVEQQRAAVRARGVRRGSREALIAATQSTLTGTRRVRLLERVDGDPYAITIQVYDAQVDDELATRSAIEAALPVGLKPHWKLEVLSGQTLAQLRDSETLGSMRAKSFDDVRSRVPDAD